MSFCSKKIIIGDLAMDMVRLLLILICFTLQAVVYKTVSIKNNTKQKFFAFCSISYFLVAVFCLFIADFKLSPITLWLGILYGATYVLVAFIQNKMLSTGSMSYTYLFSSSGVILTIIFGIVFLYEKPSVLQIIGFVFLFVSFYFSTMKKDNKNTPMSIGFIILGAILLLANGSLSVSQKAHQTILNGNEITMFIMIAFFTNSILMGVLAIVERKKTSEKFSKIPVLLVLSCTGVTLAANFYILYLSSRIPAIILYPFACGGTLVMTALTSVIFYKEKLSKYQIVGLIFGGISIALLCI